MIALRAGDLCRAIAASVLIGVLAGCSTLGRPIPSAPSVPVPTPPPPTNVDAIPDAVPRVEPRSPHGNPPFYDVLGKRYFVLGAADGYIERGVASWYGPTFHGVNTSSGERYDMYGMTAAHKTLPLPTYARVTNLRNGRSITVRINDRGPFVANRLIDLSYTAADPVRSGGRVRGPGERATCRGPSASGRHDYRLYCAAARGDRQTSVQGTCRTHR